MKIKNTTKTDNKPKYKLNRLTIGHAQLADILLSSKVEESYSNRNDILWYIQRINEWILD